jgi:hypothetical protein
MLLHGELGVRVQLAVEVMHAGALLVGQKDGCWHCFLVFSRRFRSRRRLYKVPALKRRARFVSS